MRSVPQAAALTSPWLRCIILAPMAAPSVSVLFTLTLMLAPCIVGAQSLEPRLYLPLPIAYNTVVLGFSRSSGDVILDGTVPITDVQATLNSTTLVYAHTFGMFGRSAQVQTVTPIVFGTASALVAGEDTSRTLRGFADPQVRLAVNLKGGPARRRAELAGVRFGTILAASLTLSLPFGEYDHDRYLNVGANRWAAKPEVAVVQTLGGGWAIETYGAVWLFGHNTGYVGGATATQDPLWLVQGHLVRLLGNRAWVALDGAAVRGGASAVDGVVKNNFQQTTRFGATWAWVVHRGHAFRGAFSTGVQTRFGGDFDVLSLGYSYTWGS
jgi:outer membrane putative beta-barrel porin/alpha-amylase